MHDLILPKAVGEYPLMACRPLDGRTLSPFRELYAQGVRVLHVDATFSEDIFHPELRAWQEPGRFDYSYQEAYWESILRACPDARFCLRLYAGSPPWWDETHPGELQKYADGSVEAAFQRTPRRTLPSLASQKWHEAAGLALEKFLLWLESSGWAERVWGVFLCYGITWEWGILGTDRFPDYSEPMRGKFRRWLAENYGEVGELRCCWGDPQVTFETAEIPLQAERMMAAGDLRMFPRDRASADFQNCLSDANCDYLLHLGSVARRVAEERYKVGAFYGYTLTSREHTPFTSQYGPGGLAGGHHAFGRFLRSGLFDFNASPYAYANRNLGNGCLIQHFARASCQWHGLKVYDENDLRPFLVAGLPDDRAISVGQTETLRDSIEHQRWALAQALCHGTSYWWTELSGWIGPQQPYYDDPALLRELQRHCEIFQNCTVAEPEPAEIAIIIDERSIAALSLESKLFMREIYDQLPAWSWCAAPFDVWLAEDVSAETMQRVRLAYVFAPAPSSSLRARLRKVLCRADRTVWWAPYTGSVEEGGFSELTGHDDPKEVAALRKKTFGTWTSLYGACAGMDARSLAEIARVAGVKMFGEAPMHVMKGRHFLALQAGADRSTTVDGKWRNLWDERWLEGSGVTLEKDRICLFEAGSAHADPASIAITRLVSS